MKLFLGIILIVFLVANQSLAQSPSPFPEFGNYTTAERTMKECSFDPSAEAIILIEEANADYDDEYHLITSKRVRIKILKQSGVDRANIIIPFYSKDQFEFIDRIEGQTYDPETGQQTPLSSKSIYTERENNIWSNKRFAMPNVKVGSIIEYKYTSVMKHYGGLQDWKFQSELPTMRSAFKLQILPGAEFTYLVTKKTDYPIEIIPMKDQGRIYFEMKNVPGLRFEPYMDARKDYIQRVEFQLAGFTNVFGSKQNVLQKWKDIAMEVATDKDLGGAVKKNLPVPPELKLLVDAQKTQTGKARVIYDYVRNNFTHTGYTSKYAVDGIKKVWDRKAGTNGEINLVLLNLLSQFDIDAFPLLAADRSFGKVFPEYPLIDRFNMTVAYIVADGKTYIVDATQKYSPFGLTPYGLLNTYALVASRKTDNVMLINSGADKYEQTINLDMKLVPGSDMEGTATVISKAYAKESHLEELKKDEKKYITSMVEKEQEGLKVVDLTYKNHDNDSDLVQEIKFRNQVNENGGFLLLNCNLFTSLHKTPFSATERFTNVNFGYPQHISVHESIELPDNYSIDDIPKDMKMQTPDKEIIASRQIVKTGKYLHVTIDFQQEVTLVPYEYYDGLKEFYQKMVEMLNKPIVIKVSK